MQKDASKFKRKFKGTKMENVFKLKTLEFDPIFELRIRATDARTE